MMKFFILFFVATISSYFSISYIRFLSHRYKILASPTTDRWHNKPIPVHGSFGFYIIFLFIFLFSISIYSPDLVTLLETSEKSVAQKAFSNLTFVIALVGSSLLFFVLGFLDDLFSFRASIKFLVQILICALFILDTEIFYISENNLINFLYTLVWLVGITNASNLIDSFDGICGSIILLAALAVLLISINTLIAGHDPFYLHAILSILIGSLFGFLIHNYPPAKIFMGDSGSLSLGFIIAAITIPSQMNNFLGLGDNINIAKTLIPICFLSFPIFDTTLVTISRILNKKKIYLGGKDHTAHRLASMGFSSAIVLLICLVYAIIGITTGFSIHLYSEYAIAIFLIFFLFNFILMCFFIGREFRNKIVLSKDY